MSARGTAWIESTDDAALNTLEYIQDYRAAFAEPDELLLDEVNWLRTEDLLQRREVGWIAYMDADTEQAGTAIIHLPHDTDVFYTSHVDGAVSVPVDEIADLGSWIKYRDTHPEITAYLAVRHAIEEARHNEKEN